MGISPPPRPKTPAPLPDELARLSLGERFTEVRQLTETICSPLEPEDFIIQAMPDVSPAKWHLAHTTWFFETLVLKPHAAGFTLFNEAFGYLFNSYYEGLGARHPRPDRGLLARPGTDAIFAYRAHVDEGIRAFLRNADARTFAAARPMLELGLQHEQQHQELLLTDIKYNFSRNPLAPVYRERIIPPPSHASIPDFDWVPVEEGVHEVGHDGTGFAFDNEYGRHKVYLAPVALASRLVTNGEYLSFIQDGGYAKPDLWLAEGWDLIRREGWRAPLYWEEHEGEWRNFTLQGMRPLNLAAPVCHVSYFEADAFAHWAGWRLPTEQEWEVLASRQPVRGNFLDFERLHPCPLDVEAASSPAQMFGDVWEWTMSSYAPYPGFRPAAGAVGEYNGKFMCNQYVLRGGSCVTPSHHVRPTYRNFFPTAARWQFSGIRLAKEIS